MIQKIVVAAAIIYQNRILAVKRADNLKVAPGVYHLPGGHVNFGESPEFALKREIKEELQVSIEIEYPIDVFHYDDSTIHTIGIVYLCKLSSDSENIILNLNENSIFEWITEKEIDNYFTQSIDHNKKASIKAFSILRYLINKSMK